MAMAGGGQEEDRYVRTFIFLYFYAIEIEVKLLLVLLCSTELSFSSSINDGSLHRFVIKTFNQKKFHFCVANLRTRQRKMSDAHTE